LGDPAAAQAQLDLTAAYNDAAGRTLGAVAVAGNLGGQTLTPGLYKSTSSLEISSGDLTLDAQGDPNGVFLFEMASTLITTTGRQVILAGGAQATNVYWQVGSSATLGTSSVFKGNILALASITAASGAGVEGRLLARTGGVSLDANVVTIPANNTAGVTPKGAVPNRVSLASNPLRSGSAAIRFGLANADQVEITIYDLGGRVVRSLVNRHYELGSTRWRGTGWTPAADLCRAACISRR
jgi:type VI secretion system secreted protein VgrG